jgi:outer membrane murein-binding lipoprotein Lpp
VTVRQKIDQLSSEESVGDLGYSADQRMVATAVLGLQLLADEIDQIKSGLHGYVPPEDTDTEDISAQLADLTAQVKKLRKAVKKVAAKTTKNKK